MENGDLELRRVILEEKKVDQENQARIKELDIKLEELRRSRWTSPLIVGIFAASIAATGNGYVSWLSAEKQFELERHKQAGQKELDQLKHHAERVLEATKGAEPKIAAAKIKFLVDVGLIPDPNQRAALDAYIRSGDQSAPNQPNRTPIAVIKQSGWLGGGNNQADQCAILRGTVVQENPGKTILLKSSSEQNKKDFLGRVEYKYFCNFEVM